MSDAVKTPDIGESATIPELGLRISLIAEQHGGRKALADLLGVAAGTLGSWCRGETEPRARHLRRIAHLGSTTVDALLCDRRDQLQEEAWCRLRDLLSDRAAWVPLDPAVVGAQVIQWTNAERCYRMARCDLEEKEKRMVAAENEVRGCGGEK